VPSFGLTSGLSLGSLALPGALGADQAPGVTIAERTGVSLCSVLARKGAEAKLTERVSQVFGIELPRAPRYTASGAVAFAWAGPLQWLALGNQRESREFESHLRSSFAGVASVIDQSDGRTLVRVSGPRAHCALAKGVLVDLHRNVFQPSHTAITSVANIGVHFWQIDPAPTYEFSVSRSFAVSFCEWLVHAAAEFGIRVEHLE
jgi:heterotetrameric sarcosine oxidase gamma subunit